MPDVVGSGRWRTVVVEKQLSILFGWEETGRDGVDPHAFHRPLASQEDAQAEDRCFGHRIAYDSGQRDMRGNAGDVDNASPPARRHGRAKFLARKQDASY